MDIREKSLELIAHEKLLLRLSEQHEMYNFVSDRVYQLGAGLSGEQEVDRILPEIGLPPDAKVMKDITFEFLPNHFVQLDTIIVTKKCIILFEVKRYAAGIVEFNEEIGKTIRISNDQQTETFDCVIDQIDRAAYALKQMLKNIGVHLPIIPVIVIANNKTMVTLAPKNISWKYPKQLPRFIRTTLKSMTDSPNVHTNDIYKFLQNRSYNKPFTPLCKRYNISTEDLIKGVLCNDCQNPISGSNRTWNCNFCRLPRPDAFNASLLDWFYLVDTKLTNRYARDFFNISSAKKMSYLLSKSTKLKKCGIYRHTYYVSRSTLSNLH